MAVPLVTGSHSIVHTAPETGRAVRLARTTTLTGRFQLTFRVYRDRVQPPAKPTPSVPKPEPSVYR